MASAAAARGGIHTQQADSIDIKCHSDVVRPIAADRQGRAQHQPITWVLRVGGRRSSRRTACPQARAIRQKDDDFSFAELKLTREARRRAGFVSLQRTQDGQIKVLEHD